MQKHLDYVPNEMRYCLDDDFRKCAKQVFIALVGREPEGKTDSMDWVTMKNYRSKCREIIESLETRVQNVSAEERNKNFLMNKQLSFQNKKQGGMSIGSTTTLSTAIESITNSARTNHTSQSKRTAAVSIVS